LKGLRKLEEVRTSTCFRSQGPRRRSASRRVRDLERGCTVAGEDEERGRGYNSKGVAKKCRSSNGMWLKTTVARTICAEFRKKKERKLQKEGGRKWVQGGLIGGSTCARLGGKKKETL